MNILKKGLLGFGLLAFAAASQATVITFEEFGITKQQIVNLIKKVQKKKEYDIRYDKATSLFMRAKKQLTAKRLKIGIQLLSQVLTLVPDHQLAIIELKKYNKEKQLLVTMLIAKGLKAFNKNEYASAHKSWRAAKALDEKHPQVINYLRNLNTKKLRY